jgi:hypothetical protein
MPQKGGGGNESPEEEEQIVQTVGGGPMARSLDRKDEFEGEDEFEFVYGDIVHDEEQTEPEDLVVVNIPETRIDQWDVESGTLSDQNPGCPGHDNVIVVVLLLELDDCMPEWGEREEEIPLNQLDEDGVSWFAYPSLRLDLIGVSHLRDG